MVIGTKYTPPYACIFMDKVKTDFLDSQKYKSMIWFHYITIFSSLDSWTEGIIAVL